MLGDVTIQTFGSIFIQLIKIFITGSVAEQHAILLVYCYWLCNEKINISLIHNVSINLRIQVTLNITWEIMVLLTLEVLVLLYDLLWCILKSYYIYIYIYIYKVCPKVISTDYYFTERIYSSVYGSLVCMLLSASFKDFMLNTSIWWLVLPQKCFIISL